MKFFVEFFCRDYWYNLQLQLPRKLPRLASFYRAILANHWEKLSNHKSCLRLLPFTEQYSPITEKNSPITSSASACFLLQSNTRQSLGKTHQSQVLPPLASFYRAMLANHWEKLTNHKFCVRLLLFTEQYSPITEKYSPITSALHLWCSSLGHFPGLSNVIDRLKMY